MQNSMPVISYHSTDMQIMRYWLLQTRGALLLKIYSSTVMLVDQCCAYHSVCVDSENAFS